MYWVTFEPSARPQAARGYRVIFEGWDEALDHADNLSSRFLKSNFTVNVTEDNIFKFKLVATSEILLTKILSVPAKFWHTQLQIMET